MDIILKVRAFAISGDRLLTILSASQKERMVWERHISSLYICFVNQRVFTSALVKLKSFVWLLSRYSFIVSYSVFAFQDFRDIAKGVESFETFRVAVRLYFVLSIWCSSVLTFTLWRVTVNRFPGTPRASVVVRLKSFFLVSFSVQSHCVLQCFRLSGVLWYREGRGIHSDV